MTYRSVVVGDGVGAGRVAGALDVAGSLMARVGGAPGIGEALAAGTVEVAAGPDGGPTACSRNVGSLPARAKAVATPSTATTQAMAAGKHAHRLRRRAPKRSRMSVIA